jgi:hypothetical protein
LAYHKFTKRTLHTAAIFSKTSRPLLVLASHMPSTSHTTSDVLRAAGAAAGGAVPSADGSGKMAQLVVQLAEEQPHSTDYN